MTVVSLPTTKGTLEKHVLLTEEPSMITGCTKSLTVKVKQSS